MRGSVKVQANYLMQYVFKPNTSKHQSKAIARANGAKDWHSIGKTLDVYSYGTRERYFDVWVCVGKYAKERSIKSFDRITPDLIRDYLQSKLAEGVSKQTMQTTMSAIEKLELALNRHAETTNNPQRYDFQSALKEIRKEVRQMKYDVKPRAYQNPQRIIENLKNPDHRAVAELQYRSGARIHEAVVIKLEQLKGFRQDIDGTQKGVITIRGKGGKVRDLLVPTHTYEHIQKTIESKGIWKVDQTSYRKALKEACLQAGEKPLGSHGLRWNYASERLNVYVEKYGSLERALAETSKDMGHDRADITLRYLRR